MLQNQTEIYILQETVAEFTWITSETKNKTNKISIKLWWLYKDWSVGIRKYFFLMIGADQGCKMAPSTSNWLTVYTWLTFTAVKVFCMSSEYASF